jgi:hypothetical protein
LFGAGRFTEGREALASEGRALDDAPPGLDTLGREGVGRETFGRAPPAFPMEGREA